MRKILSKDYYGSAQYGVWTLYMEIMQIGL